MLNALRKWPYFKFYPNDWLTSNTILLMTPPQIGSYIMLLCRAWTEEDCTLPIDPGALMTLSKWEGTVEEFAPVLDCFPLLKNQKRRHNPRLYRERHEAIQYREKQSDGGRKGMQARWAAKTPHPKPEQKPVGDWLTTLRTNPAYQHIPIEIELAKMDAWLSTKPGRKKTKSFVVNWLNKIDPPLEKGRPNGQALIPPFPGPDDPIGRGRWHQAYGNDPEHPKLRA